MYEAPDIDQALIICQDRAFALFLFVLSFIISFRKLRPDFTVF